MGKASDLDQPWEAGRKSMSTKGGARHRRERVSGKCEKGRFRRRERRAEAEGTGECVHMEKIHLSPQEAG